MNCYLHPGQAAVVSCNQCTVGICADCFRQSITLDEKPVCRMCAPALLTKALQVATRSRIKAVIAIVVGCALMLLGLIGAINGFIQSRPDAVSIAVFNIILCFGLAGLPSMWSNMRSSPADQAVDRALLMSGHGSGVLIGFVFKVIFAFLFGTIIAPLNAYKNFRIIQNTSHEIHTCQQLLAEYQ